MWHCNSTGIYSGVNADGNGDSSDLTNIDKTFLRGIQETSEEGVAGFTSIFPGHYTSRATHIHVLIHTNITVLANDTLGNDVYASHVGQTFFDQNLIDEVEALAPYNTNQQELTLNENDSILSEETRTDGVDPVFEYTLLGDSVADGLFAWIAFGIDTTQSQAIKPATFRYQEGESRTLTLARRAAVRARALAKAAPHQEFLHRLALLRQVALPVDRRPFSRIGPQSVLLIRGVLGRCDGFVEPTGRLSVVFGSNSASSNHFRSLCDKQNLLTYIELVSSSCREEWPLMN
ncbi:hypothetical protein V2G26_013189 [Clonostachys chloroleuca]